MIVLELSLLLARQYVRNVLLVSLLIVVPTVFISTSYYTTRATDIEIIVTIAGGRRPIDVWMPDLHGAIMVPIVTAFLAGIAGLFIMLDASRADGRLAIAGVPARTVAATRILLISLFGVAVALLAVGVTVIHNRPEDLFGFAFANLLVALSYGFIGALAFLAVGRLGGAYLMLFVPMIDIGIFQDPMMISGEPPGWMKLLPGFGGTRFALDAAFTERGDDSPALLAALVWAVALALAAAFVFVGRTRRS
jgi:lysylphosphatidylglycerol synthetase-like protein (DUF2156 family)